MPGPDNIVEKRRNNPPELEILSTHGTAGEYAYFCYSRGKQTVERISLAEKIRREEEGKVFELKTDRRFGEYVPLPPLKK